MIRVILIGLIPIIFLTSCVIYTKDTISLNL